MEKRVHLLMKQLNGFSQNEHTRRTDTDFQKRTQAVFSEKTCPAPLCENNHFLNLRQRRFVSVRFVLYINWTSCSIPLTVWLLSLNSMFVEFIHIVRVFCIVQFLCRVVVY